MDSVLFQRIIDRFFSKGGVVLLDLNWIFLIAQFSGIGFSVSDSRLMVRYRFNGLGSVSKDNRSFFQRAAWFFWILIGFCFST